jgi:hypothetical protein
MEVEPGRIFGYFRSSALQAHEAGDIPWLYRSKTSVLHRVKREIMQADFIIKEAKLGNRGDVQKVG